MNIGGGFHNGVKTSWKSQCVIHGIKYHIKALFQVQLLKCGDGLVVCLQDVVLESINITFLCTVRWCDMWQMVWSTVRLSLLCDGIPSAVVLKFWAKSLCWTSYWTIFLSPTLSTQCSLHRWTAVAGVFKGPDMIIFVCVYAQKNKKV
jgi:hypothetical protein